MEARGCSRARALNRVRKTAGQGITLAQQRDCTMEPAPRCRLGCSTCWLAHGWMRRPSRWRRPRQGCRNHSDTRGHTRAGRVRPPRLDPSVRLHLLRRHSRARCMRRAHPRRSDWSKQRAPFVPTWSPDRPTAFVPTRCKRVPHHHRLDAGWELRIDKAGHANARGRDVACSFDTEQYFESSSGALIALEQLFIAVPGARSSFAQTSNLLGMRNLMGFHAG